MIIDSHHHLWRYTPEDYGWISSEMSVIRRDFLPADLESTLSPIGITGTVAVQARQTEAETDWLLELATRHPIIRGVVGWIPLAAGDVGDRLDRVRSNPRLRGVRHVLQDEADAGAMMASPAFNAGLAAVTRRGLVYDLLIFSRHLDDAIALVDRHPNLRFVLDHIAKPVVQGPPDSAWTENLRRLAERPNVACKFSGVVTEVPDGRWDDKLIAPYFETVLEAFGSERVLFGSDWPVCLLASSYQRWLDFVTAQLQSLSEDEKASILGLNALNWYSLPAS